MMRIAFLALLASLVTASAEAQTCARYDREYVVVTASGGGGSGFPIADDTDACWGTGDDACYQYSTAQTADAMCLGLSVDSETLHIAQKADCTVDWGQSDLNTPTVIVHDADHTDTTKYLLLQHDGTRAKIDTGVGPVTINASDPADSGALAFDNAESICWEAAPAATDVCLTVNASEEFDFGSGPLRTTGLFNGGAILTTGLSYQNALTTSTPTGTTQTIDWASGNVQKLDLESATGDVTVSMINPQVARLILVIQQDGAGGAHNVVWPGTVLWANATAPTISTGNDAVDVAECIYDGASYLCAIQQDFQ